METTVMGCDGFYTDDKKDPCLHSSPKARRTGQELSCLLPGSQKHPKQ